MLEKNQFLWCTDFLMKSEMFRRFTFSTNRSIIHIVRYFLTNYQQKQNILVPRPYHLIIITRRPKIQIKKFPTTEKITFAASNSQPLNHTEKPELNNVTHLIHKNPSLS